MADIESALARLEAALDRAGESLDGERAGAGQLARELDEIRAERDRLQAEVIALRDAAEEDARLRAEAAEAVRSALADLRGLVREESHANA